MAPRDWYVGPDEDLNEAFLEASAILYRLGGAMSIVAHREEVEEGVFVPAGASFRWESFSPAKKVRREEEVEEHADDLDLEPAPSG